MPSPCTLWSFPRKVFLSLGGFLVTAHKITILHTPPTYDQQGNMAGGRHREGETNGCGRSQKAPWKRGHILSGTNRGVRLHPGETHSPQYPLGGPSPQRKTLHLTPTNLQFAWGRALVESLIPEEEAVASEGQTHWSSHTCRAGC